MSSLAAARADNFYYPPEYKPEHGSLNKFRGSHPLGIRAKRIHEGVLVIRFEMPYKVFCLKCNEVIAKGVRFNAEKKCVGNYFSTKIWEFSMKCCFCDNIFRIETDPEFCDYKITAGLKKKVETFSAKDAETTEFLSPEERAAIDSDAMLKLEMQNRDQIKAGALHSHLEETIQLQMERSSEEHYYEMNSLMRKRFRQWKALEIEKEKEDAQPKNFALPLVPLTSADHEEASSIRFLKDSSKSKRRLKDAVAASSSIFSSQKQFIKPICSRTASKTTFSEAPCKEVKTIQNSNKVNNTVGSGDSKLKERIIPDPQNSNLSIIVSSSNPLCLTSKQSQPKESALFRRERLRKELIRIKMEKRHSKQFIR